MLKNFDFLQSDTDFEVVIIDFGYAKDFKTEGP